MYTIIKYNNKTFLFNQKISPNSTLPRTACQKCADKLVDFHLFSLLLLESQNELLATEETLSVNLCDAAVKLSACGPDDDDIEIDEMVLELFSRLHENDPSCERELADTTVTFDHCQLNDVERGTETEMALEPQAMSFQQHGIDTMNETILQENALLENQRTNETPRKRGRTPGTIDKNRNEDELVTPIRNRRRQTNNGPAASGIEIISQEIIKHGVTSGSDNNANDIVRIELSFVDKPEKKCDSGPNPRVYICDICHKNFPVAGRFLAHFRRVHLKSLYKKQMKCPYCPRYFTTIGKLYVDERKSEKFALYVAHGIVCRLQLFDPFRDCNQSECECVLLK